MINYLINKKVGRLIDCNSPRNSKNHFENKSDKPWNNDPQKQSYYSTFESLRTLLKNSLLLPKRKKEKNTIILYKYISETIWGRGSEVINVSTACVTRAKP